MADIINICKLREAKEAVEATARLHEVLCIAADAATAGALSVEGRLQLLSALLPAFAPGLVAPHVRARLLGGRRFYSRKELDQWIEGLGRPPQPTAEQLLDRLGGAREAERTPKPTA